MSQHPEYDSAIIPRLKAGSSLLDIGSCLGQDLRKCVFDGAPPENLYATDVFPEYEELSFDLWQDKERMAKDHYITADLLADNAAFSRSNLMMKLGPGQMDIIAISMFLHLFDKQNQLRAATRILRLLSHNPGSMIVGSQAGVVNACEQPLKPPFDKTQDGEKRTIYRHSPSSFTQLWEEAGLAAGVPLKISAIFQVPAKHAMAKPVDSGLGDMATMRRKKIFFTEQESRRLYFTIVRS